MMDLGQYEERDFLNALTAAKADGNQQAVAEVRQMYQQWMAAKDRKKYDPTKGMSGFQKVAANYGAGVADLWEGMKQLTPGGPSGAEMREKAERDRLLADSTTGGRALQGLGVAATLAPLAFVPGANTVAGASALGGATGALMPTTGDSLLSGKALNAGLGAAGGALMQKAANMVGSVAPRAYNATLDWWAKKGLPGASAQRQAQIAERAFVDALPDPQAARLRLMQFQEQVPGVRTSTASALNDRPLLAVERTTRETAGPAATILRDQELANNAARWNYLQELGGDVQGQKDAAWKWFADQSAKLKPKGYIDPQGQLVSRVDNLIDQYGSVSSRSASALAEIRESLANALRANNGRGDIKQLHKVRMFQIDDRLSSLGKEEAKVAGALRTEIGGPEGLKRALDEELNRVTSGRWSNLMRGFAERRRLATQFEAANTLRGNIGTRTTTVTGEPSVTSSMPALRKAAVNPPEPRYGAPTYSVDDAARISTVTQDIERQMSPFKIGVSPKGSATAANALERGPANLMDYMRQYPHVQVSDPTAALAGGMVTGSPGGALTGVVANEARRFGLARSDRARDAIASRIASLLADQNEAYRLLESLNTTVRAAVQRHLLLRQIPMTGGAGLMGVSAGAPLGVIAGQSALSP